MMLNETSYLRADALGFLAPQGQPPVADLGLPEHVDLLHVTAAPPFFGTMDQIMDGGDTPDGRNRIPGLHAFSEAIESQNALSVIKSRTEMAAVLGKGTTAIVLGLQEAPREASESDLRRLREGGIAVMALEYQRPAGQYGSGWLDPDGPLTDNGKALLEGMASTGLILDLSHSGDRTARDAIEFIDAQDLPLPVMASHGGIREWYQGNRNDVNNRRNLSLDTLQSIQERGGILGIYALTFGLSDGDNSAEPFYDHLHRAAKIFPDSVVIGSDATYQTRDLDEWAKTFEFLSGNIADGTNMVPRHPDTPFELNSPARLSIIENKLLGDGMSKKQAAKIVGQNLVSFFRRSLS
jgi:membrane dipeptidase